MGTIRHCDRCSKDETTECPVDAYAVHGKGTIDLCLKCAYSLRVLIEEWFRKNVQG